MLSPKYQRYAERLRQLVEEGRSVARLERPSSVGPYFQGEDKVAVHAWLGKAGSILATVFGSESPQLHHYREALPNRGILAVEHSYDVYPVVGVVAGALDDLENGFLIGQEFIIAGELFDSVLEQAKQLNAAGYKDPAAVLARTVLEDSLKRLARAQGLADAQRAASINDQLKAAGRYPQAQWRFVQAWLDIGNAAAHGKFADFSERDVTEMIDGIERFLAAELR